MLDCYSTKFRDDLAWLQRQAARSLPLDAVDDVVQETALAAWLSRSTRDRAGLRTWLNGILRHKTADHYRRTRETVELQDWHFTAAGEQAALVRMMLRDLPERYARVLWLRFWEGMSFAECGAEMGCSMEAAKGVYRRAIIAARGWWLC